MSLPSESQVETSLSLIGPGLRKYVWIQEHLASRDVSTDHEFQRRFVGFYRVRRDEAWRRAFFALLEARKGRGIAFPEALRGIFEMTGRVEASFASKLVATIDPKQPVIDAVVLKNVEMSLPAQSARNRLALIEILHDDLRARFDDYLGTPRGMEIVRRFRKCFPDAVVTDVKALDLILWQVRDQPDAVVIADDGPDARSLTRLVSSSTAGASVREASHVGSPVSKPEFLAVYACLEECGPATVVSSRGTTYRVRAQLSRGLRTIVGELPDGRGSIRMHEDCWGSSTTCTGTRAGGILNGDPSIFHWYSSHARPASSSDPT